jgi:two-component system, cell cycle sensor histidine kinase and response regulator CckA
VLVAGNGVEALENLEAAGTQVALVLTDMVMPEMGGRELVERVASDYPGVRILCMSGYTEDPTLRLGQLAGEHGFIAKPFTVPELTAAIRRVLDGSPVEGTEPSPAVSAASSARG